MPSRRVICLLAGVMSCPPSRNGNMPAGRERLRRTHGVIMTLTTNANYNGGGYSQTRDVGQYAANPWGFFDMNGNIREWTADWYQAAYPTGNPVVDPTGPASGSIRVLRGGSWSFGGPYLRSAKRDSNTPGSRGRFIGFRVGFQKSL